MSETLEFSKLGGGPARKVYQLDITISDFGKYRQKLLKEYCYICKEERADVTQTQRDQQESDFKPLCVNAYYRY